MTNILEPIRRLWTPKNDIEEVFRDLSPQTELDSILRDFLHRTIQQRGPVTLDLSSLNTGQLRWEVIHHEPQPGIVGGHEVSLWVEDA